MRCILEVFAFEDGTFSLLTCIVQKNEDYHQRLLQLSMHCFQAIVILLFLQFKIWKHNLKSSIILFFSCHVPFLWNDFIEK